VSLEVVGGMLVPANDPYFKPRLEVGLLVEPETLDAALVHVRDWRCALDIGAHIGCWTKELASRFGQVVAFEPQPENFAALTQNTARHDNVRRLEMALADRWSTGRMSFDGRVNSGEWYLSSDGDGPKVRVCSLDDLALDGIGLVKMDVECAEHLVIAGAERTLRKCRPVVLLEEHTLNHEFDAPRRALESWGAVEVARFESAPTVFDVVMAWPYPPTEEAA
jgi:FkbM family methyltransferase